MSWQPGASLEALRARAQLKAALRQFFAARNVLEVDTPLLCRAAITDPSIEPLCVAQGAAVDKPRYLQTSPEYAMKRLLAAGSGPIYQIAQAFRDAEVGPRHNPEFTLLEWYRPGFDEHQLMAEVAELVSVVLGEMPLQKFSYSALFAKYLRLDPWVCSADELREVAVSHFDVGDLSGDKDMWLDLLMSHVIEPQLPELCFVHDYPPSQAALARVEQIDGRRVARRFELYVNGVELANGYCELADSQQQGNRFEAENAQRLSRGQQALPVDEYLLDALANGFPFCSGVALGLDRLLMLQLGETDIRRVLSFDWQRC